MESILGTCDHGRWNTLGYAAGCVEVSRRHIDGGPRTVEHVQAIHLYRHGVEPCSVSCELAAVDTVVVV